jgi:beta-galactosidase
LKSWWGEEPVLHLSPHWNWPGREGQAIEVRADSNCEDVELFLNGASLGRQSMPPNGHLAWTVTYAPGVLLARGYRDGREIVTTEVATTGPAAALALVPDRATIEADGRDVAVVSVAVKDAAGRTVPTANVPVTFSLRGPGRIIGVGNGDPSSLESDQFIPSVKTLPLGHWEAPDAAPSDAPIVFEARFDRPAIAAGDTVDLLLNALGPKQSVWLNGQPLYREQPPERARSERSLDPAALRPTGNVLRIESTRFADWSQREGLRQFHPAALRIETAAPAWKRITFNGLAQVIVQSTGEPGEIVLEATSAGLATVRLPLTARQQPVGP